MKNMLKKMRTLAVAVLVGGLALGARAADEAPSLVVTTAIDVEDATDGVISLREAISHAMADAVADEHSLLKDGRYTITFDPAVFTAESHTITVSNTLIVTAGKFTTADLALEIRGKVSDTVSVTLHGGSNYDPVTKPEPDTGVEILKVNKNNYVNVYDLTFTHAKATSGAGLYNLGTMIVQNCTFMDNFATSYSNSGGAGLQNGNGSTAKCGVMKVINCTFRNNKATGKTTTTNCCVGGGALRNDGGWVTIEGSDFQDNEVSYANWVTDGGGAIYSLNGFLSVSGCTFKQNKTPYEGSAVYIFNNKDFYSAETDDIVAAGQRRNQAFFTNTTFTANGGSYSAGAVYVYGKIVSATWIWDKPYTQSPDDEMTGHYEYKNLTKFTDCTFNGNFVNAADDHKEGGAISAYNYAKIAVDSCRFYGNVAQNKGGAIAANNYIDLTVSNSTFGGDMLNATKAAFVNYDKASGTGDTISNGTYTFYYRDGNWYNMEDDNVWSETEIERKTTTEKLDSLAGFRYYNEADGLYYAATQAEGDNNASTADFTSGNMAAGAIYDSISGFGTTTGNGNGGGAIAVYYTSNARITNCTFRNNKSSNGGAIFTYSCSSNSQTYRNVPRASWFSTYTPVGVNVEGCSFIENKANLYGDADKGSDPNYKFGGGAIYSNLARVRVSDCLLQGNRANNGGACYHYVGASLATSKNLVPAIANYFANYANSTFIGNAAEFNRHEDSVNSGTGGAIASYVFMTRNSNVTGGNLLNTVTAANCTFTGNTADGTGAVRTFEVTDAYAVVTNTAPGYVSDLSYKITKSGGGNVFHSDVDVGGSCALATTDGAPLMQISNAVNLVNCIVLGNGASGEKDAFAAEADARSVGVGSLSGFPLAVNPVTGFGVNVVPQQTVTEGVITNAVASRLKTASSADVFTDNPPVLLDHAPGEVAKVGILTWDPTYGVYTYVGETYANLTNCIAWSPSYTKDSGEKYPVRGFVEFATNDFHSLEMILNGRIFAGCGVLKEPVEVATNGVDVAGTTVEIVANGAPLEPQTEGTYAGRLMVQSNRTITVTWTVTEPGTYFADGTETYTQTFEADKPVNPVTGAVTKPAAPSVPQLSWPTTEHGTLAVTLDGAALSSPTNVPGRACLNLEAKPVYSNAERYEFTGWTAKTNGVDWTEAFADPTALAQTLEMPKVATELAGAFQWKSNYTESVTVNQEETWQVFAGETYSGAMSVSRGASAYGESSTFEGMNGSEAAFTALGGSAFALTNVTFRANTNGLSFGGAMFVGSYATGSCVRCQFLCNGGVLSGGGIYVGPGADLLLEDSQFEDNGSRSAEYAAALYVADANSQANARGVVRLRGTNAFKTEADTVGNFGTLVWDFTNGGAPLVETYANITNAGTLKIAFDASLTNGVYTFLSMDGSAELLGTTDFTVSNGSSEQVCTVGSEDWVYVGAKRFKIAEASGTYTLTVEAVCMRFLEKVYSATEGGVVRVYVWGGSPDRAVQATVSYRQGTGAFSAAYVDGRKVSFPLALNWAKGDVSTKEILFRTAKSSSAYDRSFTLQLGSPVGEDVLEGGDVCTVNIVKANGSGKTQRFVRALAYPANGGTVSGSGTLTSKTVKRTLSAKAKATAVFAGWYAAKEDDANVPDFENRLSSKASYVARAAGTYFAYFTNVLAVAEVVDPDAAAAGARGVSRNGETGVYEGMVGVKFTLPCTCEGGTVKATGCPAGLSWKNGAITGVPSKKGTYSVTVTASNAAGSHRVSYTLMIKPLAAEAVGTWTGVLRDDPDRAGIGSVTFSATSAGKLSAKVTTRRIGCQTFSGTGYASNGEGIFSVSLKSKGCETFKATLDLASGWGEPQLSGEYSVAASKFWSKYPESGTFALVRNPYGATGGSEEARQLLAAYVANYGEGLYSAAGAVKGSVSFKVKSNGSVLVKGAYGKAKFSGTVAGGLKVWSDGSGTVEAAIRNGDKRMLSADATLDSDSREATGDARYISEKGVNVDLSVGVPVE